MKRINLSASRALIIGIALCITFLIWGAVRFTEQPYTDALENSNNGQIIQPQEPHNHGQSADQFYGLDIDSYFRGIDVPDDILAIKPPSYLPDYKNPCWYEHAQMPRLPATKMLRCLPYFHIIGVGKNGILDLWHRLSQHPDSATPHAAMKETHWWSSGRFGFDKWNTDIHHFDWYLQHFNTAAVKIEQTISIRSNRTYHHLITGEGSPTIFWDFTGWKMIPQNKDKSVEQAYLTPHCLKHITPGVKLIVILRDPTESLYSDELYLDKFYDNVSAANFHQDVLKSVAMLTDCLSKISLIQCVYTRELHMKMPVNILIGMYDIFMREWLKVFPRSQILILRDEDYFLNMKSSLRHVFEFLELEPLSDETFDGIQKIPSLYEKSLRAKKLGAMMPQTRHILNKLYSKFNKALASRLQDSRFLWRT